MKKMPPITISPRRIRKFWLQGQLNPLRSDELYIICKCMSAMIILYATEFGVCYIALL